MAYLCDPFLFGNKHELEYLELTGNTLTRPTCEWLLEGCNEHIPSRG